MILYLPDSVLKAARVVDLGALHFCPASSEEMASLEMSEVAVKRLYEAQIDFIIELERNDVPPLFVNVKPHKLNAEMGIAWFVPTYFKYPKPRYEIEFKSKIAGTPNEVRTNLTERALDELVVKSGKVLRVYSVHGLTAAFLDRFNLRIITKGKFKYAVPKK